MPIDKREHPRYAKRVRVRYRSGDEKWRNGFVKDLSSSGLFVESSTLPTVRQIELEVQDGDTVIALQGTVSRGKKVPPRLQGTTQGGFAVSLRDAPEIWYRFCLDVEERARLRGIKNPAAARFIQVTTEVDDDKS